MQCKCGGNLRPYHYRTSRWLRCDPCGRMYFGPDVAPWEGSPRPGFEPGPAPAPALSGHQGTGLPGRDLRHAKPIAVEGWS